MAYSRISASKLAPNRDTKTEMPYAIITEYSQKYFQSKIGRKLRVFSLLTHAEILSVMSGIIWENVT